MAFQPATVNAQVPIYLNPSYTFRERAADLVSRMTIEEKQSQLGNTMPPIPRLAKKIRCMGRSPARSCGKKR